MEINVRTVRFNELNSRFRMGKVIVQMGVGWFLVGIVLKFVLPSSPPLFVIVTSIVGIAVFSVGVYQMRYASLQLQRYVADEQRTAVSVISSNRSTELMSAEELASVSKPPDYECPPDYEEAIVKAMNVAVDKSCSVKPENQH